MFREDDLGLATRAKWFPSVAPSHLSGRHEEVVKKGDCVVSGCLNQQSHASCTFSWNPSGTRQQISKFGRIFPISKRVLLPPFWPPRLFSSFLFQRATNIWNKCLGTFGVRFSTQDKLFQPCCHPGLWAKYELGLSINLHQVHPDLRQQMQIPPHGNQRIRTEVTEKTHR